MTSTHKKVSSILIKIGIVLFAFWFIYKKLDANSNLKKFVEMVKDLPRLEIWTVISVVFILMLVNWTIEAVKWRRLISPIEAISLWKSIESVFCGLTWAVFTPNRIGEYGGRVFFLSPKRRIAGVVAMAVGNIGQLVLTNVFGPIAICIFVFRFTTINTVLYLAVCGVTIIFTLFFLIFFFNIRWLNSILLSMRFTRKYKKFYKILARYQKIELLKILSLSLARYVVFSSQYFIILRWLIPDLYSLDIVTVVCILFFVQSALPSLDLLDIGIRSVTALFFFKYVTQQSTAVVACTASIWLINIIIPAILGAYFVFKLNFFGNTPRT